MRGDQLSQGGPHVESCGPLSVRDEIGSLLCQLATNPREDPIMSNGVGCPVPSVSPATGFGAAVGVAVAWTAGPRPNALSKPVVCAAHPLSPAMSTAHAPAVMIIR